MPLIVSITGPFGAGKSQLAKLTAAFMGAEVASRVPADYFLAPRPDDQPFAEFLRQPLVWDWPLLDQLLSRPLGTATTTPDFDFATFTRRAEHGGLAVTVRPVMLVDAMPPHPRTDLLVRLDASAEVRRQRLAERDLRWGTAVTDRWQTLAATERAVSGRQHRSPDMSLDGERPLAENAAHLATLIRQHLIEGPHPR